MVDGRMGGGSMGDISVGEVPALNGPIIHLNNAKIASSVITARAWVRLRLMEACG